MKKRSFWISAAVSLAVSAVLGGCGATTYFAVRPLPPSGLLNRVLIAVQNPGILAKGELDIVDAYYDIRSGYNTLPPTFQLSGFGGALPLTIQNMPEEQLGAVYSSGDGSFTLANYSTERTTGTVPHLNGPSSSIFITRNGNYVFAASQQANVLTVVDQSSGASYGLSLPGVYRVSVNPGGSVALAFVQNSNYAYYARKLSASESFSYSGGPGTWPKAAVDCEPQNAPAWCVFQVQSPDHIDPTGHYYGVPLVFDRPVKAVFSADGGTAYVLNCGPECGGKASSVSVLPVGPLIFRVGQQSGLLPGNAAPCTNPHTVPMTTVPVVAASNALVDSHTMYVVGQRLMPDGYFGGYLAVLDSTKNTVVPYTSSSPNPVSISDGLPGGPSRMLEADDNTLWIGMTKCNQGERFIHNEPIGCLTMYNTSTKKVVMLEPYLGDLTGIAAITNFHKIYVAEGGQVYIYATTDGTMYDNQYVTVTGVASDVAYMDAISDANNTVY